MEALKELVKVLNRKRLSKIDVLDKTLLHQTKENLYYRLYEGLENGKITDDASAAKYLYGSTEKDAKYRKLKSRFRSKLMRTILLFDNEDVFVNSQSQAYYECLTNNHIIEVLLKLTGTSKLVYELVQDSLPKAKQFKFYDILKNYSFYMLSYYSVKGDQKSFNKEQEKYLSYLDLSGKEQYAKFLFYKSSIKLDNQSPITDDLLKEVELILLEMTQLRKLLESYEIDFFYFFLALEYYQKSNKLDSIISICDEAEYIMTENTLTYTNTRKIIILFFRLNTYLSLKKFEEAIKLIKTEKALQIPVNYYNWFLLKETEFKLYLHNNNVKDSYRVYEEVIDNNSFKNQVDRMTEKWKIYHAYLVFLDSYLNKGDYKFSLPKFLNSVPVNSKDKSGFNFAIRIIELLFQFARGEDAMVFHKMDALRVYRSRYLNDNTYKRNHLFLSLLLKSEKSGFDYKVLHKADWQEIQGLRDRKHIIAEWEIIPYEELWDIFVELAKR
jgi:hypothetical protein